MCDVLIRSTEGTWHLGGDGDVTLATGTTNRHQRVRPGTCPGSNTARITAPRPCVLREHGACRRSAPPAG